MNASKAERGALAHWHGPALPSPRVGWSRTQHPAGHPQLLSCSWSSFHKPVPITDSWNTFQLGWNYCWVRKYVLCNLTTKKPLAQDQKSGLFHLHYLKTFIIYSLGDLMIFSFPDHYFFCNKPFFLSPSSPALFIYLFFILNVLISHCYVVFNQHLCVVQFRVD